jgi:hypothetical protein
MFLWFPVLDLARAPRRTARKKGSGYENGLLYNQQLLTWGEKSDIDDLLSCKQKQPWCRRFLILQAKATLQV